MVSSRRSGFTLLELLLALALTGLVLVVINMAIDLQLRTLDLQRTNVEETQVARAVLRKIATDLRSVVIYEPIDMSGVQDMSADSAMDGLMGGMDDLTGGGADAASGSTGSGEGTSSSDRSGESGEGMGTDGSLDESLDLLGGAGETLTINNADIAGTVTPTNVPGLYGNQFELQVDVSHLPRADQYELMFAASALGGTMDIPSDVKTVSYYLRTEETQTPVGNTDWSDAAGAGLVRREMDRAVTEWGAESGELDTTSTEGQLIAPEVNYLEFRYFDGLSWVTEWDSDEMGGLPMAIEVTLGIDPTGAKDPAELQLDDVQELEMTDPNEFLYRMVVHLPVAKPIEQEDSLLTEDLGDLSL